MRCTRVKRLVERCVDGSLKAVVARKVEAHASSCRRCTRRLEEARMITLLLGRATTLQAPQGFARKVMANVYGRDLREPLPSARSLAAARLYRRLALSFLLSACVLALSLLLPRGAYSTLVGSGGPSAGISQKGAVVVRNALLGAKGAVRGILLETRNEGRGR